MIKFFRKIRQNLLMENKTGKYFKYAIGEIMLVVIGILIAVQINTLVQNKNNHKLEKQYLSRFLDDLEQDYKDRINLFQSSAANAFMCIEILKDLGINLNEYSEDEFLSPLYNFVLDSIKIENNRMYYNEKGWGREIKSFGNKLNKIELLRQLDLTAVTFNDLMANGKMEVIHNEELRIEIQKYYSNMLSHLGYQEVVTIPAWEYYLKLIKDIGIHSYSAQTLQEVKNLIKNDHRLATSVRHILTTNLRQMNFAKQRRKDVQTMKDKIMVELVKT